MGGRWNSFGFQLLTSVILVLSEFHPCFPLNLEGLALLEFRAGVRNDPYGVFKGWNSNDSDPCMWFGVHCVDGEVQVLDLHGLSLEGLLSPELVKLTHLRSLILYKNCFSEFIPKEFGRLIMLETLDLRENNLSGTIPVEFGGMLSLQRLLLCGNKFEGTIPVELEKLNSLVDLQIDQNLVSSMATGIGCINRKFGHSTCQGNSKSPSKKSFTIQIKGALKNYFNVLPLFNFAMGSEDGSFDPLSSSERMIQNTHNLATFVRRRLLEESMNLPAAPATGGFPPDQIITLPTTRSSGAFPAIPNGKSRESGVSSTLTANPTPPVPAPLSNPAPANSRPINSASTPHENSLETETSQQQPEGKSGNTWKYVLVISGVCVLLIVCGSMFFLCRKRGGTTIGPWKTGLSGQLQKAFVTGVPKLNRMELDTACEDFSNIIDALSDCTVYKGTLSSGVEIAVASSAIKSSKDWPKYSERAYRKKIDKLSRVNHKNFVNLLGFCEENEPFVRMMVFEYAPNGMLSEHLHVREVEHLDWHTRMRIIMGTAYCLQYMHHDLNPPAVHPNLNSSAIYLTDDYAAKIADISFLNELTPKSKISGEDESEHSESTPVADTETNVYCFGMLLLEIISGKLPHSEEHGSLINWASEYLNDTRPISNLVDPSIKSFKNNELEIICEVVQDCIQQDPRQRPTMKEATSRLKEVIGITSDAATPRLSPLWWAELEILSTEAT